jgi:hypothetical protein
MGIKNAHEIVQQIVDTVSQWDFYAKEADVKKAHSKQIKATLRLLDK